MGGTGLVGMGWVETGWVGTGWVRTSWVGTRWVVKGWVGTGWVETGDVGQVGADGIGLECGRLNVSGCQLLSRSIGLDYSGFCLT